MVPRNRGVAVEAEMTKNAEVVDLHPTHRHPLPLKMKLISDEGGHANNVRRGTKMRGMSYLLLVARMERSWTKIRSSMSL